MATTIGWLLVALGVLLGVVAVRAIRADARSLGNAVPLALALVCLVAGLVLRGSGSVTGLLVLAAVVSPLMVAVLVVFLLANGVTMMRREGRSLGNLLSLLAGIGLVLVAAVALLVVFVWPLGLPVMLLVLMATGWAGALFCGYLAYSWLYQQLVARRRPDYIVTLGSGLIGDRVPPLLAGRIDRAIEVFHEQRATGGSPVLVMSGGKGSDEKCSEAEAMGRYAVEHGIDERDLLLETASVNTEQNLRNTRELVAADPRLGAGATGLAVTSNYHAMRAADLARRLDVPVDVVGARTAGYFWPSAVLREFVAVMRATLPLQLVLAALVVLPLPIAFAVVVWR